ncbi:MAG: CerR family C-terminal domain-containing protein [Novosphingobium sp.]
MADESLSALKLVEAALPIFGLRGVEGASTREIAKASGKPMSAITYHFGGKEGLYLACARHISTTLGGMLGTALDYQTPINVAEARARLSQLLSLLVNAMLREETAPYVRFIFREQQEPTAAFDLVYGGVMGRVLTRLCELTGIIAGGRITDIEIRVRVIALMGQVMGFRVARAATLRLTGWSDLGDSERALIDRVIQSHLKAILDHLEQEQPV